MVYNRNIRRIFLPLRARNSGKKAMRKPPSTSAAKTSKSNVYNYFRDKDVLFAAVLEPTLSGISSGFEKLLVKNPANRAETYSMTAQKDVIMKIMGFVFRHDSDLKLLLFRSSGLLADFKGSVTESLAELLTDWIPHAAPNKGIFYTHGCGVLYWGN